MKKVLFLFMMVVMLFTTTNLKAQIYARGTFCSYNTDYDMISNGAGVFTALSVYITAGSQQIVFADAGFSFKYDGGNGLVGNCVLNSGTDSKFTAPQTGYYDITFDTAGGGSSFPYSITLSPYSAKSQKMWVSGSFNGYGTANRMALIGTNLWRTPHPVSLDTGNYNYKFRNDPNWTGIDWGGVNGLWGNVVPTSGGGANATFTITNAGYYYFTFNDSTLAYSISTPAQLPIQFVDFALAQLKGEVSLSWSTTGSINTTRYIIERSCNGEKFSSLGQVNSLKLSSDGKYNFVDNQPFSGKTFYRIVNVDAAGKETYSKVLMIDLNIKEHNLILYPNPATMHTQLLYNSDATENVAIQIVDLIGHSVIAERWSVVKGNNSILLNLSKLTVGFYFIKINNQVTQFIKE